MEKSIVHFSEVKYLDGLAYNVTDIAISPQGDYALITAMGISEARATPFGVLPGPDELTGGVFVVDLDTLETISFLPTALKGENTREMRQALATQGGRIKHPRVLIAEMIALNSEARFNLAIHSPGSGFLLGATSVYGEYVVNNYVANMMADSYRDFGFLAAYAYTYPHDMIGATGVDISNRGDLAFVTMEKTNNVGVIPVSTFTSPLGDISFDVSQIGFESASPKKINAENIDWSLNGDGALSNPTFSFWGPADVAFSADDSSALIGAYGGFNSRYGIVDLDKNRDLVLSADPLKNFIKTNSNPSLKRPKRVAAKPAIDNDGDGLSNHVEAFNRWNDGRSLPVGDPSKLAGSIGSGLADINIPAKTQVSEISGRGAFYLLPHSGVGYRLDYLGHEKFSVNAGNSYTIAAIEKLGRSWADSNPSRPYFIVQSMAHAGGGNLYNKSGEIQDYSSRLGFDANISYFSNNSDEPFDCVISNGPGSPRDNSRSSLTGMDRAATNDLIDILVAEPMVKEIWIDALVHRQYDGGPSDKFVVRGEWKPSSTKRRDCDSFMKVVFGGEDSVQILVDGTSRVNTEDGVIFYQENSSETTINGGIAVSFLISDQNVEEFSFGTGDQLFYDAEMTQAVDTSAGTLYEADWLRESPVLYVNEDNPSISITTYDADGVTVDDTSFSARNVSVRITPPANPVESSPDSEFNFPGWADGFDLDKSSSETLFADGIDDSADDDGSELSGSPLTIELTGAESDAYLRISYPASPPGAVSRYTQYKGRLAVRGNVAVPSYHTFFKLPDTGLLRLWKNSSSTRELINYVAPGIHKLSDLGAGTTGATLFLEAVTSDSNGCLIEVALDPDGPGPAGFLASHSVVIGGQELLQSNVSKIEVGQTAILTPNASADSYKLHYDPRFLEIKLDGRVLEPGVQASMGPLEVTALQETYVPGSSVVAVEFISEPIKDLGIETTPFGEDNQHAVNEVVIEPGVTRFGRVDLSGVWTGPKFRWEHSVNTYENPIRTNEPGKSHKIKYDETHVQAILEDDPTKPVDYEMLEWVPEFKVDLEREGSVPTLTIEDNKAIVKAGEAAGYVLVQAFDPDNREEVFSSILRIDIGCDPCRDCDDEMAMLPDGEFRDSTVSISMGNGNQAFIKLDEPSAGNSTTENVESPYENYDEADRYIVVKRLGLTRQILTQNNLIDFKTIDEYAYRMDSYPLLSSSEVPEKQGGLYSIEGLILESSILVRNPRRENGEDLLEIIESRDGEVISTQLYSYNEEVGEWTRMVVAEGDSDDEILEVEQSIDTSGPWPLTTTTETKKDGEGNIVSQVSSVDREFSFGSAVVREVIDPNGANLETTYEYYEEGSPTGSVGRLKLVKSYDGFWTKYEYDDKGRKITEITPWLNSDSGDSNPNNHQVMRWTYLGDSRIVSQKTVEKLGFELECTFFEYGEGYTIETIAVRPGAAIDDPDNLSVRRENYPTGFFKGHTRRVELPNGVVTLFEYDRLDGNTVIRQQVGVPNAAGDAIQRGTSIEIINNKQGREILREVYDIESGQLAESVTVTDEDNKGRPRRIEYLDGTYIERSYGCCGLEYEVDRMGIRTDYSYDAKKRLIAETRLGVTMRYTYSASGKLLRTREESLNGTVRILSENRYNSKDGVSQTYDAGGRATAYDTTYLPQGGRRDRVTLPSGAIIDSVYAGDGRLLSVSGSGALPKEQEYGVEMVDGIPRQYAKSTFVDDDLGNNVENAWVKELHDMQGRMVRKEFSDGSVSTMHYNALSQHVRSVDADGVTHLFAYNDVGDRVVSAIDMDQDGVIDYDGSDRVTSTTNAIVYSPDRGIYVDQSIVNVWTEEGDSTPAEATITERSLDGTTTWVTNAHDETSVEETAYPEIADGSWLTRSTAPDGSYVESQFKNGLTDTISNYDANGTLVVQTAFTYDEFLRVKTETTLDGVIKTYYYNTDNNIDYHTVTQGTTTYATYYTYNELGLLVETLLPDNTVQKFAYDDLGRINKKWGSQEYPVEIEYDSQGRIKERTTWKEFDVATGLGISGEATTSYVYDDSRNFLLSETDALGRSVNFTYHPSGRLKTRTTHRGITATYAYNAAGDVERMEYSDSTPDVVYTYDRLGRPDTVIGGTLQNGEITAENQLYAYDYTYTSTFDPDAETMTVDGVTRTLRNNYQTAAEGVQGRYAGYDFGTPSNYIINKTLGYDTAGRISQINSSLGNFEYGYEEGTSNLQSLDSPVHTTRYAYDHLHDVRTGVVNEVAFTTASSYTAQLNALGQIETLNRDGFAFSGPRVDEFTYDARGQIDRVTRYAGNAPNPAFRLDNRSYNYDFNSIGNRTLLELGPDSVSAPTSSTGYTPNTLNQIDTLTTDGQIKNLNYDVDGNLIEDETFDYTWDAENRLLAVSPKTPQAGDNQLNFQYDYQGRRIVKTVTTWDDSAAEYVSAYRYLYFYDGWEVVYEQTYDSTDTLIVEHWNLWGLDKNESMGETGGTGGLLARRSQRPDDTVIVRYYLYDLQANVSQVLDEDGVVVAGYEYSPFGRLEDSFEGDGEIPNPYRYSGYYTDMETGLVNYGLRLYSPELGVWLSRDPVGVSGGENLYALLDNDPINFIDRLGLKKYLKDSFSENISSAFRAEWASTYGQYSAVDWIGWGLRQKRDFTIGAGKGALLAAWDLVKLVGTGIGVGAAYLTSEDVRAYVHNAISEFFGNLKELFDKITQCLSTRCCRLKFLDEMGPEAIKELQHFMRNPGQVLGELAGTIGFDVAITVFTGGFGAAKALGYLSRATKFIFKIFPEKAFAKLAKWRNKNLPGAANNVDEFVDVYRAFGDDARAQGFSWTTKDPRTVNNFRDAAGLPSGGASGANNSADFLIQGRARVSDIIESRSALPLDGNRGGLPELIIDPKNVDITDFSVLNP